MLKPLPHVSTAPFDTDARSEDVKFSPSGRLLAVVTSVGRMLLFVVDVVSRPVRVVRHTRLLSDTLANPHGIEFLSEDVVVVANRRSHLTAFRLPDIDAWAECTTLEPILHADSIWFGRADAMRMFRQREISCGPGSVRAFGGSLYVCCNRLASVTAHPYRLRGDDLEIGEGALVGQWLGLPDGVAVSRDGHWVAVSDHDESRVVVHRRGQPSQPCSLRDPDLRYPHGLCFDPSGRRLYVGDAGSRYLHVFATEDDWNEDTDHGAFKLVAVGEGAFDKTRDATGEKHRALEGGIKGLDVDPSGRIVATTCRHQTLRFFET